jgi:hypothetical protein
MCSSPIPVDDIEWLNSDGEVITSEVNISKLSLTFAPVNTSINNEIYTCRVTKNASLTKTIAVSVTGKTYYYDDIILLNHMLLCNTQWKILWK